MVPHLDQGHAVPVRPRDGDVDKGVPDSGALAPLGPGVVGVEAVVGPQVLVLRVDVLALLARPKLTVRPREMDMVGVEPDGTGELLHSIR